ncbi:tRNA preQ1(34) S-adenosylmethionine ribosyltransferase-isomerase QueA [Tindallia californiensis]|uniref:S-adenosylmethionine:tRNA ribosyltransferase-isomerase n=1 Tax=Tindallia californiensis TaxID=159292 RepID=A0A1H3NE42_9FIRM|nr:tRNA preQ1(34) S-adenosylmethionine ribosyltransferase-isomerase QueA [Tindallia californiensis]SDY87128.1 S-adenosylmethionine--tRNA ribosyltransferase-isomerase [Tindallia californiensis]
MKTSDFYYKLPEELIAQKPLEIRDQSRLMIVNKSEQSIQHKKFCDVVSKLNPGDGLVINTSRVIPARLTGRKRFTNGKTELLLLKQEVPNTWEVMVKPAKRIRKDTQIIFGKNELKATVLEERNDGLRLVKFQSESDQSVDLLIHKLGEMPLPPYIHEKLEDKERYQTVYSEAPGSAAAPTAGLHFTEEILSTIKRKGIHIIPITLHVGLGTFRPVQSDNLDEHKMHEEFFEISQESAATMNKIKEKGGRIVAVGTTSCRALESSVGLDGQIIAAKKWTNIFIKPGYEFRFIDILVTNFHLPESTLLMLVSALAGKEFMLRAYEEAVNEKYRFFSFGDAMWIE